MADKLQKATMKNLINLLWSLGLIMLLGILFGGEAIVGKILII